MDLDTLQTFLNNHVGLVMIAAAMMILLVVVITLLRFRQAMLTRHVSLQTRLDSLWHEMDYLRVQGPDDEPTNTSPVDQAALVSQQFASEKAALEQIWPVIWDLHDKLGTFLRNVESGESAGDSRLAARSAALHARAIINSLRPFYEERLDDLLTRLIDADIKAHLAACQYLDHRHSGASESAEGHREKFRLIYEGDARELLNQLIALMRRRLVRSV